MAVVPVQAVRGVSVADILERFKVEFASTVDSNARSLKERLQRFARKTAENMVPDQFSKTETSSSRPPPQSPALLASQRLVQPQSQLTMPLSSLWKNSGQQDAIVNAAWESTDYDDPVESDVNINDPSFPSPRSQLAQLRD